ncbi:type II secretion system minor pseudopilin GspI [Croceicoccus gelatinilyticus]|uniref:type II secretion system minor pseudopilin GspI n=1 Tax=Croceicoccus gelatinilyticus TaxID=2835536 RepID=UPI001BCF4AB9|nr:type II secretion system minor pseudopilin GspI [Croceicoccus gelatinilyticus]MBS7670031.1 type II secretion system minor pseudopilin GspI [Croceicoccus gelatinilyticus]
MKRRANGFTLIELLVALAIFAIAGLTLMRMEGASIARTADLEQRLLREVTAQNLAAEWLTDPLPPALGDEDGMVENAGRQFQWSRMVEAPPEFPGTIRIVLSLREVTPGRESSAVTYEFLRVAPS